MKNTILILIVLFSFVFFTHAEDYFTVKRLVLMMTKLISEELKQIKSQICTQLSNNDRNHFKNTS